MVVMCSVVVVVFGFVIIALSFVSVVAVVSIFVVGVIIIGDIVVPVSWLGVLSCLLLVLGVHPRDIYWVLSGSALDAWLPVAHCNGVRSRFGLGLSVVEALGFLWHHICHWCQHCHWCHSWCHHSLQCCHLHHMGAFVG